MFVGGADAHTTIDAPGAKWPLQRWVNRARVPTPDVTLSVVEGLSQMPCVSTGQGCTDLHTIWIPHADAEEARFILLHEIGHNFDVYVLPWSTRERLAPLLGEYGPWDFGHSETFANSYGICAEHAHIKEFWIEGISAWRQRMICGAIRKAPLGEPREDPSTSKPYTGPMYVPTPGPHHN